MNCKQGDLAVIVKSYAGNEGKIVRCIDFIGDVHGPHNIIVPTWRIDRRLPHCEGGLDNRVGDFQLRPIRDADGQDETLTWKDVPHKEVA